MYGRLHLPARLVPRLTPGDVASASELPVAASYRIGARRCPIRCCRNIARVVVSSENTSSISLTPPHGWASDDAQGVI